MADAPAHPPRRQTLERLRSRRRGIRWGAVALTSLALIAGTAPAAAQSDGPAPHRPTVAAAPAGIDVIVRGVPGTAPADVAAIVAAAGGTVTGHLDVVDGVSAQLPRAAQAAVAADPRIVAVTADQPVAFQSTDVDDAATATASAFVGSVGADTAWGNGLTGAGVGVAVIDTGISEMNDFSGRLVHGPDLSGEGTLVDTYGHGTAMAGIIGGDGTDSADRADGAYTGVAPGAHLVAVKVAGANGAADVSTLLQAMHWVAAYREQFNIRVLNISWGTPATQDPTVDPLNYAVQRLWDEGIVVVAAAGNDGPHKGRVLKPGDDPKVITVGAFDDKGTVDRSDDSIVSWTSRGTTPAGHTKPDVAAPGRRLISTRSHGSTLVEQHPRALHDPSYIRGSGSSQAAAVTSGAVALMLEHRPELTPDQVKALLARTTRPINGAASQQNIASIDVTAAMAAQPGPAHWQSASSTGLGSIEASRGGHHVVTDCDEDGTADVIEGEIDDRCNPWTGSTWTGSRWTGDAWTGSTWTGSTWTGSRWTGSTWTGSTWTGSTWTGGEWVGSTWNGSRWTGSTWNGSTWNGSRWTGSRWTGTTWTGSRWTTLPRLFAVAQWDDDPAPAVTAAQ